MNKHHYRFYYASNKDLYFIFCNNKGDENLMQQGNRAKVFFPRSN